MNLEHSKMATGNQLMDEIYDQFLICKICYEIYKRPKTLSCLHTFCEYCLEKHQDAELERSYRYMLYSRAISCPICRKKTELPSGGVRRLPDNFLVENLTDVVNRRKPTGEARNCEICKPSTGQRPNPAVSKCLDCSKLLCKSCVDLHRKTKVTEAHSLFDTEVEKDIRCKVHEDEVVRFYCEPCEVCICVVCTFQEHKGHDVSSFPEGIAKYSHSLDSLLDSCRQRIATLKDQLHLIQRCEGEIKKNEQHIRDMAIESISVIRKKEKQMIKDLHALYGQATLEFMKSKEPIQENIETLQSTFNLTDIILRDKSIELLLLRKEIQEKIEALLELQPDCIPENLLKEVRFIPGNLVFGYLDVGRKDDMIGSRSEDDPEDDLKRLLSLKQAQLHTVDTQTEVVNKERATTMGKCLVDYEADRPTQTDSVQHKDRGTITITVTTALMVQTRSTYTMAVAESRDNQTMTLNPTVTRRKTQTDRVTHANVMTWTKNMRTNDQCIATDDLPALVVPQRSAFTMTSPSVKDCETMTPQTPTMRRKMQTSPIRQTDQMTETQEMDLQDKCTNTLLMETCERSTLTTKRSHNHQTVDTRGLYLMADKETETPTKRLKASSTATDLVETASRSTLTTQPAPKDKCIGTPLILQYARETNTPVIHCMDMGVSAKMPSTDVGTATRNIVLADTGTGGSDVNTEDKGTEPWLEILPNRKSSDKENKENIMKGSGDEKAEKPKTKHKGIFTNFFNMVSKDTETEKMRKLSVSVGTVQVESMDMATGTPSIQLVSTHTDSQEDKFVLRAPMCDSQCQTIVSLKDNLEPVDQETSTQAIHTQDKHSLTDLPQTVDTGMTHKPEGLMASTMTDSVSNKSIHTNTYVHETCDVGVITEKMTPVTKVTDTKETAMCTEMVSVRDSSHDAYRGQLCDLGMNTDHNVVVKPLVGLSEMACNTNPVDQSSKATSVEICMKDTSSDPICPDLVAMATNTDNATYRDSTTSMFSNVETKDSEVSTLQTEYRDSSCLTSVDTIDMSTETTPPTLVDSETHTEQVVTTTRSVGTVKTVTADVAVETATAASVDTGSHPIHIPGQNKETCTPSVDLVDTASSTTPVILATKSTSTTKVVTKHRGTFTYVPTVDKATYYPTPITMETGTVTKVTETIDRKVSTEKVPIYDAATMTVNKKYVEKDTTMSSLVLCQDSASETLRLVTTDSATDAVNAPIVDSATNTENNESRDVETNTKHVDTVTSETTTNHRVDAVDQMEGTDIMTCDKGTIMIMGRPQDRSTMTFIEKHDVGILKRPHTVSRTTEAIKTPTKSRSIGTVPTQLQDAECMTDVKTCEEKGIQSKAFAVSDQFTSTPQLVLQHAETSTPAVHMEHRASSPLPSEQQDRASSPLRQAVVDRENSPIPYPTQDQLVQVRPEVKEQHTATPIVETFSTGTSPQEAMTQDREASPIKELFVKDTADVGTTMPPVCTVCRETSPIPLTTHDVAMTTDKVQVVDRESTPVRMGVSDEGVMVCAEVVERGSDAVIPPMEDKQVATRKVVLHNSSTEMPQIYHSEKETSTPQVHVMHRFIATDNTTSADKQTSTYDVTSEYRGRVVALPPVTVCRGTCTTQVFTDSKQTSPPPLATTDKASSPMRTMTRDKGVMAKKGEIIEPVDKYQAPGIQKRPLKPIFNSPKSSLEMIKEEAKDSSSSDEDAKAKSHGMMKSYSVGSIPLHVDRIPSPKRLTHKEAFFMPSLPRLGKPKLELLSVDRLLAPSTIQAKVEVATNTVQVGQKSCGTSTPVVDTEDKAICTESVPVDGKMAECINKLKTVRQRLEQPKPVYSTATSQPANINVSLPAVAAAAMVTQAQTKSEASLATAFPLSLRRTPAPSSGSDSNNSDQEQTTGLGSSSKNRLARKQRLNISQLLRSASLPDNNPKQLLPPLVRPKLQVQAIHRQVIPKMDELVGVKDRKPHHQKQKKIEVDALVSPTMSRRPSVPHQAKSAMSSKTRVRHREKEDHEKLLRSKLISKGILLGQDTQEPHTEECEVRATRSLPATPKLHKHMLTSAESTSSSSSGTKLEDSTESTDS